MEGYTACGSGCQVALGALDVLSDMIDHPAPVLSRHGYRLADRVFTIEDAVIKALKTAGRFNIGVAEPYYVLGTSGKGHVSQTLEI